MPAVRDEVKIAAKLEMLKAVDDRRYEIARLYIQGNAPMVIARKLGHPLDVVREDLDIVRKEWIGLATQELVKLRADEYRRLWRRRRRISGHWSLGRSTRRFGRVLA